jgi:hypothetical protein
MTFFALITLLIVLLSKILYYHSILILFFVFVTNTDTDTQIIILYNYIKDYINTLLINFEFHLEP